jgi:hypothetical protein
MGGVGGGECLLSILILARKLSEEWLVKGIDRTFLILYCRSGNTAHVRVLIKILSGDRLIIIIIIIKYRQITNIPTDNEGRIWFSQRWS